MIEIEKYLSESEASRRFADGVILYNTHGSSEVLKGLFKVGESDFSRKKLFHALSELLKNSKKEISQNSIKQQIIEKKHQKTLSKSDLSDAPTVIRDLVSKRKRLYAERDALFSNLKLMCKDENRFSDDERGVVSNKILKLGIEIESIWKCTNHFDSTGELPSIPKKIVFECKSDVELIRMLNRVRVKISQSNSGKRTKEDLPELFAERDFLEKLVEEIESDVTIKE